MAEHAVRALKDSLTAIDSYSPALAERIRQDEELCDHYEDILSTYLVKLSAEPDGHRGKRRGRRSFEIHRRF